MRCVSALVLALAAPSAADYGILDLDNTTFDRIVGQGLPVLVRVDKEYPYGDSDDAWKEVGVAVGGSDAKLLLAHVGVSDTPSPYKGEEYQGEGGGGEEEEEEKDPNAYRDNQDLAARFSVPIAEDDEGDNTGMPKFLYFAADWKEGAAPVAYEGEPTKDGLLRFAQDRAGVWVGLPGQVKALHVLAQGFAAASADGRTKALAAAQADSSESGKYYAKVMAKVQGAPDFVSKEIARLTKMKDDGSVAAAKKVQFSKRLNALSSFA
jgi:hypothetical protein